MPVGKKIKILREKINLSQEELATLCGWATPARIKKYESGKKSVSFDDAVSLASILGVVPGFFLNENEDEIEFVKYKHTSVPVVGEIDELKVKLDNFVLTPKGALGNEKRIQTDPYRRYGLKVNTFKMKPEYSDNDVLIIDSEAKIIHGTNVIVKLDTNTYSIKRLKINEDKKLKLESLQLARSSKKERKDKKEEIFYLVGSIIDVQKQKPL